MSVNMRLSSLAFLLLMLASCGGNTNTQPTKGNSEAEAIVVDSLTEPGFQIVVDEAAWKAVSKKDRKTLESLFGIDNALALFDVNQNALAKAQSDEELYLVYHFLDSVCQHTTEIMVKQSEKEGFDYMVVSERFKTIAKHLPALQFTCEAECTVPRIMLDYQYFTKLAATTDGKRDDDYFSVMKDAFGDSNSDDILGATWFDMTWDYGGNSLLGSGVHFKLLKHCQTAKKGTIFKAYIEKWEEMCFDDALEWNTLYYTADKAISELKKISSLEIGKKHKKELTKRIEALSKPAEDLQLDCEHQDCSYG